ncbi:ribosome biogenesis protein erb1 [Cladophialophora psammophila CBS 110553]|uniref:Ribosome biogenesis protein ERB1 n=1 Tax=Cladophialophora psammophila CBS 110553 TaxID=1182543 RepID=W9W8Y6_9EURO|nr:ribosome biogenesis protein erb1 [Cladophialophora psammophila CBS 110553]EXJ61445.1 ribosome biogenesis protein erb1 [Cladophialophora psammophila CBS 110553]
MAESKKRKAVTRDVDEDAAVVSGDEFDFAHLDGTLADDESVSGGDEDDLSSGAEDQSDAVSVGTEELPSEGDEELLKPKKTGQAKDTKKVDVGVQNVASTPEEKEHDAPDEEPNYEIVKDANGNVRYIYPEIDPGDDSDYSVPDNEANTIGNIPLSFYDSYPHIGYNINGKKIMRPARGEALDALLDSIEVPKGWTGLTDPATGKPLELTQEELQLLKKVQMNEVAADGYDPYEPMVEWFSSKTEVMPLSSAPEPKRRFVPSRHEAKRVMKLVRAIREGRILPYKPPQEEEEDEGIQNYDIWADEKPKADHAMHMPAPKLPPPGFDESYHPPPEYIPDKTEKEAWEKADEEDREKDYLPTDHASLRKVPGYERFIKEKFERCLDLYLAPRVRRTKLNIDPDSLLPKLPSPDELRPFPTHEAGRFHGHKGRVRSLAIDPSGQYLATGGDDGTARVWTLMPPREIWSAQLTSEAGVNVVRWRPGKDAPIIAACAGDDIYLCVPRLGTDFSAEADAAQAILDAGWGYAATEGSTSKSISVKWSRPSSSRRDDGVALVIHLGHTAKTLSFHSGGNHFVTVCPATSVPASQAIAIHTISKHHTQLPFGKRLKGGGTPQAAHFHPSKPVLFVANQRVIRAYDLSKQSLLKIIQPGARWISSFDIHPTSSSTTGSDNLIVGSYDRRLLWMDLDLSLRPHKTLRFHEKAIRTVRFHPSTTRYPLFADASDDGTIQVFHGTVTSDMMSHAQIVPLKVLRGHKITAGLGVLDLDWHPQHPWLVSAGGDGTCRLWVS